MTISYLTSTVYYQSVHPEEKFVDSEVGESTGRIKL